MEGANEKMIAAAQLVMREYVTEMGPAPLIVCRKARRILVKEHNQGTTCNGMMSSRQLCRKEQVYHVGRWVKGKGLCYSNKCVSLKYSMC